MSSLVIDLTPHFLYWDRCHKTYIFFKGDVYKILKKMNSSYYTNINFGFRYNDVCLNLIFSDIVRNIYS